jgi:hypothetical protein
LAEVWESVAEVVLKVELFGALEAVSLAPSEAVGDLFVADTVAQSVTSDTSETLTLIVGLGTVLRNPHTNVIVGEVESSFAFYTDVANELVLDTGGIINQDTQTIVKIVTLHTRRTHVIDHIQASNRNSIAGPVKQVVALEALQADVG